jgi:flagellar biosynthesis/type III secretory pathway chaperone
MTTIDWEAEIIALLDELSQVQDELFSTLAAKRECMSRSDAEGMTALEEREEQVRQRLEACHHRRQQLLRAARQRSLPSDSLGKLAATATLGGRESLAGRVKETSARMRLLQHESLTNWVLAQRSLLHYAQMLEILATGGRPQPTYKEQGAAAPCAGALVNQEA